MAAYGKGTGLSVAGRREYVPMMRERYRVAPDRLAKSALLDEVVRVTGYTRKHAITVLNGSGRERRRGGRRTGRPRVYRHCLSVVEAAWEALDYCCAERLQPQLLRVAEALARHGEVQLTREARQELGSISRATLARRLKEMPRGKPSLWVARRHPSRPLSAQVPIDRYRWDEGRAGALEVDLVDHSGGLGGHHAYTLSVVDVVSGWSCRRAVMGRSQAVVHEALAGALRGWPSGVWGLHSDNGSEFLSDLVIAYCRERGITHHRSRPYRKNDNAHVEQKNRQLVREVVGFERIDSQAGLAWLNRVYEVLDPYANLILPNLKVIHKSRQGSKIRKRYDTAKTPLQRLQEHGALLPERAAELTQLQEQLNPLQLRRTLDRLQRQGPETEKLPQAAD